MVPDYTKNDLRYFTLGASAAVSPENTHVLGEKSIRNHYENLRVFFSSASFASTSGVRVVHDVCVDMYVVCIFKTVRMDDGGWTEFVHNL